MKYYIAACLLLLATLSTADEYVIRTISDLVQYRKECVEELKVPESNLEQYKKLEFPNDAVTQCYLKCIFVKFDFFDTKNGFNVENIHKQLANQKGAELEHDNAMHAQIEKCVDKNEQGSNACEWAYRGATCIIKENKPFLFQTSKP